MNDETTYFVFKLISGEEIVAITQIDDTGIEPCFFLNQPLKVELTHKGPHTMVRLIPWITICDDDVYRIGFDKIITMTELENDHEMITAYEHYNHQRRTSANYRVKISQKMGYIGNVDHHKALLEKIWGNEVGITTTV